ncbi:MAG: molybdopterin-guanine dinucleotide biosynthesis protein MobB [Dehalococcoidia bacterium]|nr:molybdopterin-guanine dinucleotide biosynthesis protein MobB [Dehalococcoidia bacterium]
MAPESFPGPLVVCVRGPSRSGKSTLCESLVAALRGHANVAWVKRTHHELDLPEKSSGRVWAQHPAAMVLRGPDRLQLTLPPVSPEPGALVATLPVDIDLVLLETHSPEPFPSVVSTALDPEPGEDVLARFSLMTARDQAPPIAQRLLAMLPRDLLLSRSVRVAARAHGGHACPGIVLGTRLALAGAAALGIELPDTSKRLVVAVETDRCAVDAVQVLTGCRPGRRTLRLLDYGKLAATFYDLTNQKAVRISVRGDVRGRAVAEPGEDLTAAQIRAYLAMPCSELLTMMSVPFEVDPLDLPGKPLRRINCLHCGEEVSDGREVTNEIGDYCRSCAAELGVLTGMEGRQARWR